MAEENQAAQRTDEPVQEQQAQPADWRQTLPEDLRNAPALKNVSDPASLAKQFVDLQAHLGNTRRVPRSDEAPEDIENYINKILNEDEVTKGKLMIKPDLTQDEQADQFYRQLGKPESPDGYKVPEFDGDIKVNEDFIKVAREKAHKYNLTEAQFQKYVNDSVTESLAQQDAGYREWEDGMKGLRQEWGSAFDQNINEAVDYAKKSGAPSQLVEILEGGRADAQTLKWLQSQARRVGERGEVYGQQGGARIESNTELVARADSLARKAAMLESGSTDDRQQAEKIWQEVYDIKSRLDESRNVN